VGRLSVDTFLGARCGHPADLDDDGDLEIVGASYYDDEIRVWDHDSEGSETLMYTSEEPMWNVSSGDFDDDGLIDLTFCYTDIHVLINSGTYTGWTHYNVGWGGLRVVVADIDGDTDPDLAPSTSVWIENIGSGWTQRYVNKDNPNPSADSGVRAYYLAAGNMDGGFDIELVYCPTAGANYLFWYKNGGSGGPYASTCGGHGH
jgi:hypothetical protein